MATSSAWPLSRILMLVLAGAFLGLVVDLRIEHVDVVRETGYAWIPIIYSACMTIACLLAAALWVKVMRLLMVLFFAAAFVVGGLGIYFHNRDHFSLLFTNPLHAWTNPSMRHPHGPPENAPMAFAGLGLIGLLACWKNQG